MPGIVGLITKRPRDWAEARLRLMLSAVQHESHHTSGQWIGENLGVYVGWTARPNAEDIWGPVCSSDGALMLLLSGEEFSLLDPGNGHADAATARASRFVDEYERDDKFPACVNGRVQGLIVDKRRGEVRLFNDRFGLHRLYIHHASDATYFAAQARAILAVCPELRLPDPRGLGEFLTCGCVLENRSLFSGLGVLPPASLLVFRRCVLEHAGRYFDPAEWEQQGPLSPEAYYQQLRSVFAEILPRYFQRQPPIGMSLTGGLDSRMILASHKPASLRCYSFADMRRDSQDVAIARQVAGQCGYRHDIIPLGRDFLNRFASYTARTIELTDGCAGVDRCADLYLNERAAEIAPVRMTGNYGGEVLRRVRAFKPTQPSADIFHPDLLPYFRQANQTYAGFAGTHPLTFSAFLQAPWHHYGLLALEETQVAVRTPFLDNDLLRTIYRAPDSACSSNDVCLRLIADGDDALAQIRTDRGVTQNGGIRAALRRKWLEFTFKAEYAYDDGMPQWVARIDHGLRPLALERCFLGRHKFAHYRTWYRDFLSGYVQEILLDSKTLSRPYLQRPGVERIVRHHLKGDRNHTTEIHQLLTLELLHRAFFD